MSGVVQVVKGPGVLERGTGGCAADGCLVGAVGVERQIQVDEVNRLRNQAGGGCGGCRLQRWCVFRCSFAKTTLVT